MIDPAAMIGFLFFSVAIGAVLVRVARGRAATLVLQQFHLAQQPYPTASPTVEIVGRMQGVVAFVLSLLGFSPITRLTLAGMELRCESGSLSGRRMQVIPIRQVSTLAAGIHKPIGNLVAAVVLNVFGIYASFEASTFLPITMTLVVGIVLVVFYVLSKKFFLEIHAQGGPPISLLFKPNVLEGVPIDAEQAMSVIGVIRDLVIASGTMPAGVVGSVSTIPAAPAPPTMTWETSPQPTDEPPPDESPFSHFQAEDEPAEVILDADDNNPAPASSEDHETLADAMLAESKQFAADGDRRRAIRLLKTVVTTYPNTRAAQQARRTLERSGIQV